MEQGAEYVARVGVRKDQETVVVGKEGERVDIVADLTGEVRKRCRGAVDGIWG